MILRTKAITLTLGLAGLLALPVHAYQTPEAEAAGDAHAAMPVPTKIVQPGVTPDQVGKVVTLRFTVDENGRPHDIQSAQPYPTDPVLVARIIRAVRAWEFHPARDENGAPIEMTVEMPIVVEKLSRS